MGFLFFLLAFLSWDVVALVVMSGSLGSLLDNLGDSRLISAAAVFDSLYALPIVGYIALAYAVAHRVQPRKRLLAFLGLFAVGALLLFGFFYVNLSDWQQDKQNGFGGFIAIPTACVFVLYLVRFSLNHDQPEKAPQTP
jgi:Na+/melibiose symporter-like transporter